MKLNDLIKFKALTLQNTITGGVDDLFLSSVPKDMIKEHTRNVCALINVRLFEELEHTCGFLGMTKRVFIEAAIEHAIEQARLEINPLEELMADEYAARQTEAA